MKAKHIALAFLAAAVVMTALPGCNTQTPPDDNPGTETPVDNPGGDNPGGSETPGDIPGGNVNPGTNPGGTTAGADVFRAFDQVGNQFWYYRSNSGSYVAYGSGRQSYSGAECVSWEVVNVSGNTATVNQYTNIDYSKPSIITFSQGSNGQLLMNGKAVTNTQSPEFYCLTWGKSGNYEWKETYNNGSYTNIFYSKSNGYTTTKTSYDISETWNQYGLYASKYSTMADDATVGSYSCQLTLKSASTAYDTYAGSGVENVPQVTAITELKDYSSVTDYCKSNPGTVCLWVGFRQAGTTANTWGYCLGMYLNDENGNAVCYPFYNINDLSQYVKAQTLRSGSFYVGDHFVWSEKDMTNDVHTIFLIFTPEGVKLGQDAGTLYFGIFALGYGYMSEVTPESSFSVSFGPSSAPAKVNRHVSSINGKPAKATPARLITREPEMKSVGMHAISM